MKKYETEEERIEAARASQKRWKEKNRERINREARDGRPASQYRDYVERMTPERLEEYRAKRLEYRKKNRDKIRDKQRELYLANAERYVWTNLKNRAKKEGLPFDIEPSDIVAPEFCPVLGIRLERVYTGSRRRAGVIDSSPSVDRIIPALGYVKGNVVVVSYRANRIKNDATADELALVANFYRNLNDRNPS